MSLNPLHIDGSLHKNLQTNPTLVNVYKSLEIIDIYLVLSDKYLFQL